MLLEWWWGFGKTQSIIIIGKRLGWCVTEGFCLKKKRIIRGLIESCGGYDQQVVGNMISCEE